jgi:chitodextrinase
MGDGKRTFTVTLTEAQYDVFVNATDTATEKWKPLGRVRSSDVSTLKRAMERLAKSWDAGIRA